MPGTERLEQLLDRAAWLGAELEPRYRVLALTVEPDTARSPWLEEDARVQVLCHPVSTILASLREEGESTSILSFEDEQLLDVVSALDGAPLTVARFDQGEPRPGEWGPRFSLEGRSSAPDGTLHTLRLAAQRGSLTLELFARFDTVELRGPDGGPRPLDI
jgi:hypothetical protein